MEPRELLTGSSFVLASAADSGIASLWGQGAWSRFDGREGDLSLSGEVTSALIGADWTSEAGPRSGARRWTAGLMLSRARGEGSYRGVSTGTVESTLTGFYPYGNYAPTDRVTVWGVAGHGTGTLTLRPEPAPVANPGDDTAMRTDMDLTMAAAGLRAAVTGPPDGGGPELSVETDVLAVRTRSDALRSEVGTLAAATGEATRARLGLVTAWRGLAVAGGALEPTLEVGVRHDGGDAEAGFGLDAGGRLAWSYPDCGLQLQLSGRGLLTHESKDFREQGVAGSLSWQPRPGRGRGPKLNLTQALGGSSSGGASALLGRRTLAGFAANDDRDPLERRRFEARFGYGFAAFGNRFTSMPELGFGVSNGHRQYSFGWRLNLAHGESPTLELALEADQRQAVRASSARGSRPEPERSAGFRVTARW